MVREQGTSEEIVLGSCSASMMGSIVDVKFEPPQPLQPPTLLEEVKLLKEMRERSGSSVKPRSRKCINSELWHACAGPLASVPQLGSLVYYFPQGHSEQVAISTKRSATSQIPNYPNLPSQLMCQVHNVTLHADKETDEIYAQMSLQPVNSEKDVFPVPDFGMKPSKHPSEFFCKNLTASDTSTHGGFSVPRRAAEKLFPPLDYTMQRPTQELVVRDLHDNTWTFRHIYRGQPKRHLLTTGWSLFVGAKRLRAGDSVLFIRDEKSQLLVGVRRENRQPTTLPSSVLSADSMHIGILAAAAHAASNASSFTIFYNPRACPSEFVVPLAKYRKAMYGTRISVGMRFGMMFETEESGKRRCMGTIIGVSDLDPLRWPGSKWRNLQVEWDEPGCVDKQNRVSPWDIETPESLFIFPSLTSSLKRPFLAAETRWGNLIKRPLIQFPENGGGTVVPYPPVSDLYSEQLIKMMLQPPYTSASPIPQHVSSKAVVPLQELNNTASETVNEKHNQSSGVSSSTEADAAEKVESPAKAENQASEAEKSKLDTDCNACPVSMNQAPPEGEYNEENLLTSPFNQHNNHISPLTILYQNQAPLVSQPSLSPPPPQPINVPQTDPNCLQGSSAFVNADEWIVNPAVAQPLASLTRPQASLSVLGIQDSLSSFMDPVVQILPSIGPDMWDPSCNLQYLSQIDQFTPLPEQDRSSLCCISNSVGVKDLSDESNNQCGIYSCFNGGGLTVNPSVSSAILDKFCSMKDVRFQNPTDCLIGTFSSSQDVQSQITSASILDTQTLSQHDFPDNSGVTSSSNADFDDRNLLKNSCSWQQVAPLPMRTYTKVQKAGSVGRSIDVTNFHNYAELLSAIECMFGLEGLLNDPRGSGWKLVYVDYEGDVLLVGDDPWEEFVGCVRCIRILSPVEVQQMSEEGIRLLNSATAQGINGAS